MVLCKGLRGPLRRAEAAGRASGAEADPCAGCGIAGGGTSDVGGEGSYSPKIFGYGRAAPTPLRIDTKHMPEVRHTAGVSASWPAVIGCYNSRSTEQTQCGSNREGKCECICECKGRRRCRRRRRCKRKHQGKSGRKGERPRRRGQNRAPSPTTVDYLHVSSAPRISPNPANYLLLPRFPGTTIVHACIFS